METIFPNITDFPVLAELVKEFKGAEAYLVGGAVRDTLLKKKITDIDIVVRGVSGEALEDFLATRGRVIFAGKHFGVWKFSEIGNPKGEVYDIALPRTEFSLHRLGAYRDFDVQTDPTLPIEKDLERRDFTINAMAYNLTTGELVDPSGGQRDLVERTIRTVGVAEERFQEDFSRLLRALRFSLQLNFTIEEKTSQTIKVMMVNINNELDGKRVVPYEVVAEEFLKSFTINPSRALEMWDTTGTLAEIVPELLKMKKCPQPKNWHTEGDVWDHTRLGLEQLYSPEFKKEFGEEPADIELILAVLFHDIGKPYTIKTPERDGTDRIRYDGHDTVGAKMTKTILNRLKVSAPPEINIKAENVAWLVQCHMIAVHGDPAAMRPVTIEKYFFNQNRPSANLVKLLFVDGLATIGPDGKGMTDRFEKICKRIEEIKKITGSHGSQLVRPLISGNDIIKTLNIKPGPRVGEILEDIRQQQLAGKLKSQKEALMYLQKFV